MLPPVLDREGLRKIVVGLVDLGDTGVVWTTDPQPMIGDQDRARIVLQLFSMVGDGWDERRREYGPPGYPSNALVTTLLGNRTLHITVRAEAYDAGVEAAELIDRIRIGLLDEAVIAQLDAINLAFGDIHPSTFVNYQVDEREVNAAIADFVFLGIARKVGSVAVDGTPAVGGWIEYLNDENNDIPAELSQ